MMFGTFEKYNIIRATFARRGASQFIIEDFNKPGQLRLGGYRGGIPHLTSDFLFDIKPTIGNTPVNYTYFCDEGSLRIIMDMFCAEVEFALTDRGHLRVRGVGAGLRLELRSAIGGGARACRGYYALPDGSGWEADFGKNGKLFFNMLSGSFSATSEYDDEKNEYSTVVFDLHPDADTREFEAAIHEYAGKNIDAYGNYEPFDEVVENNRADFAKFSEKYRQVPRGYEETAKYAAWTVWSHVSATTEKLVEPVIFWQNSLITTAAAWQQSYNAMAMLNDPVEAWRLICTLFNYQDEQTGRLPGMLRYQGGSMGMQPPFQGFALDFIIRKIGDDFLTQEECERMYPKWARWANYWTTYRNAGYGNDVTALRSPHETGWDDATNFKDGFPAEDPNNMAFLVLMFESAARLARGCGKSTEAEEWDERAKKLTGILINEYWDGEKFATKVKGKNVDALSLACYQPIILGKRLPQHIIDKIAEKLTTEGQWLTEIGLASESMKSEWVTFGISFVCGRVVGPQNMILTVGLQAAGKQKEADLIARRFCDHVAREGVILGFAPYDYFPLTGEKAPDQEWPVLADSWPWSSWPANCVLTMLGNVVGK